VGRPLCCRKITGGISESSFGPSGRHGPSEISMTLDELEALRLADLGGLRQLDGAREMGVSRATFGRILESARRKVAEALVHSLRLRIEGGRIDRSGRGRCRSCRNGADLHMGCSCCHKHSCTDKDDQADAKAKHDTVGQAGSLHRSARSGAGGKVVGR
jgi:predicted DNA-binding protein (UPF0251 family)